MTIKSFFFVQFINILKEKNELFREVSIVHIDNVRMKLLFLDNVLKHCKTTSEREI